MKKLKLTLFSLLISGCLVSSTIAGAQPNLSKQLAQTMKTALISTLATQDVKDWKVGDEAIYLIKLDGKDSIHVRSFVHSEEGNSIFYHIESKGLINQEEIVRINRDTGVIEEYRVNGEKRAIPDISTKIIKQKDGVEVTVPAGTFRTTYRRVILVSIGQEMDRWSTQGLPLNGIVKDKIIISGEEYEFTTLLVSFTKK